MLASIVLSWLLNLSLPTVHNATVLNAWERWWKVTRKFLIQFPHSSRSCTGRKSNHQVTIYNHGMNWGGRSVLTDGQTTWFSLLSKMVSRQLICGIGGGCLIKRRRSPASLGNCLLLLRSVLPQMIRLQRIEGCLRCLSAVYEQSLLCEYWIRTGLLCSFVLE